MQSTKGGSACQPWSAVHWNEKPPVNRWLNLAYSMPSRKTPENQRFSGVLELRGKDLNQRPPGYECVINTTISFIACVNFLFCVVLACFCNSFVRPFLSFLFCRRIDGQIMDKVVGFRFQNSDFISAQIVQNSCVFAFNV